MLILVSSDSNHLNSSVAKRFGHARYFILYNTETKSFETVENLEHDHHHKKLYMLIEKGVQAFIVSNIGPHAFNVISKSGKKVYLARNMSVQEAIEKFMKDELQQLNEPTIKRSIGHGHNN